MGRGVARGSGQNAVAGGAAAGPGLAQALRQAARQAGDRLGLQVAADIKGDPVLADGARQHVLAIMHEALTNAQRHGRARKATVRLARTDTGWRLEVIDDGTGFDPAAPRPEGSFGLTIMSERARILGGELEVTAGPGRGTRVAVQIPEVSG